MYELEKTEEISELIALTKSDSGISGPQLAKAHLRLGTLLAEKMPYNPSETTVVAVMRGGIFFAEGIYFQLGCKFQVYDPKKEEFVRPETKNVILVDSVINTGKTISDILTPDMVIVFCHYSKLNSRIVVSGPKFPLCSLTFFPTKEFLETLTANN